MKNILALALIALLAGCNSGDSNQSSNSLMSDDFKVRQITSSVDPNIPVTLGSKILSSVGETSVNPNGSLLDVMDLSINDQNSSKNILLLVNDNDEVILMGFEDGKNVIDAESTVTALLYLALGGTADIQDTSSIPDTTNEDQLIGLPVRVTPSRVDIVSSIKNSTDYVDAVALVNNSAATGGTLAANANVFAKINNMIINEANSRYPSASAKPLVSIKTEAAKTEVFYVNGDSNYTPTTKLPFYLFGGEGISRGFTSLSVTKFGVSGAQINNRSTLYWRVKTNENRDVILEPASISLRTTLFGTGTTIVDVGIDDPDTVEGRIFQDKDTQSKNILSAVFSGLDLILSNAIGLPGISKGDSDYAQCFYSAIKTVFNQSKMDLLVSKEAVDIVKLIGNEDWTVIISPAMDCAATKLGKKTLISIASKNVLKFAKGLVPIVKFYNITDTAFSIGTISADLSFHFRDEYILRPIPADLLTPVN